jgi:histidine ammonia-lyase
MAENAAAVIAIELLAAVQGLEFHRPLKSSVTLEKVVSLLRVRVKPYGADRFFAPDIAEAKALVASGVFRQFITELDLAA